MGRRRSPVGDDQRLVAYLVPGIDPAPSVNELRRFLQQQLPEFMVPSAFVIVEGLPLTPHGIPGDLLERTAFLSAKCARMRAMRLKW